MVIAQLNLNMSCGHLPLPINSLTELLSRHYLITNKDCLPVKLQIHVLIIESVFRLYQVVFPK